MLFFVSLLVDGALAGTIYALIALAFVVVYKASRMINFALGEWVMLAAMLVASGLQALGLGLPGALGLAALGMVALALAVSRVILRRLVGQPLISFIMVTLGLGALMRGAGALVFRGISPVIPLPLPSEPLAVHGVLVSTGKLAAALVAAGELLLPTAGASGLLSRSALWLAYPLALFASGFFTPAERHWLAGLRHPVELFERLRGLRPSPAVDGRIPEAMEAELLDEDARL